jgi:3-isopropylmalate dehydrogenase
MTPKKILILPGDGIGPEVMGEVRRVLNWFADQRGLKMEIAEDSVGGAAFDQYGSPLADSTLAKAKGAGVAVFAEGASAFRQSAPCHCV